MFLHTKTDKYADFPKAVQTGLRHPDSGKFIPKTVFTDASAENFLLCVRYESWKKASKTMRNIKKVLKEKESEIVGSAKESEKKVTEDKDEDAEEVEYRLWKNASGKRIKAHFLGLSDDKVSLRMPNGKSVKYPMSKLSSESQELAKSLSEEMEKAE